MRNSENFLRSNRYAIVDYVGNWNTFEQVNVTREMRWYDASASLVVRILYRRGIHP
jgi:hypothetical protein